MRKSFRAAVRARVPAITIGNSDATRAFFVFTEGAVTAIKIGRHDHGNFLQSKAFKMRPT